jgi:hypothetical protein
MRLEEMDRLFQSDAAFSFGADDEGVRSGL